MSWLVGQQRWLGPLFTCYHTGLLVIQTPFSKSLFFNALSPFYFTFPTNHTASCVKLSVRIRYLLSLITSDYTLLTFLECVFNNRLFLNSYHILRFPETNPLPISLNNCSLIDRHFHSFPVSEVSPKPMKIYLQYIQWFD